MLHVSIPFGDVALSPDFRAEQFLRQFFRRRGIVFQAAAAKIRDAFDASSTLLSQAGAL